MTGIKPPGDATSCHDLRAASQPLKWRSFLYNATLANPLQLEGPTWCADADSRISQIPLYVVNSRCHLLFGSQAKHR